MKLENGAKGHNDKVLYVITVKKRKRVEDSPEQVDSDSDYDEADLSFADILNRAMTRQWQDEKNRIKGRQGRSRESRERQKRVKEETKHIKIEYDNCSNRSCRAPHSDFLEDSSSGDVICSQCGVVQSTGALGFSNLVSFRFKNKSKPYQKVVHFRQRYAQLVGKDPYIQDAVFLQIRDEVLRDPNISLARFGKKSLSLVLKRLEGGDQLKRLSANWIQVRRRMGLDHVPGEVENPPLLYKRLCARYICVANIFLELLFSEDGERGKEDSLERRNIVNVNYLFVQLLRLESEEMFQEWGKFFPQLHSKRQPRINNLRWKILVEGCKNRYKQFAIYRTEEKLLLDWEYKELTKEDINKYCSFFD